MNHLQRSTLALLLAATFCVGSGCDPKDEPAPVTVVTPAVPAKPEPTAERALERARARWERGVKADWVAVYDYAAPEAKRERPLNAFLAGMQSHKYENMRATEVVALQGTKAFVRVVGLWTPVDARVKQVKLEPGQSLTQEIEMIEGWQFVDGDWCHVRSQRVEDFYQEHPELLKKSDTPPVPPAK